MTGMRKGLHGFIAALLVCTVPAYGQGTASRVRSAGSLPAACQAGGANTSADVIVVSGQMYQCGPSNNQWLSIGSFKGPNPVTDITKYGARPLSYPGYFSTTASCVGTTAITLGTASSFQNGDGITIYGCGSNNTLTTPLAPTVTPSVASGGTGTGLVVNSVTASSTYSYEIVARTLQGALTAVGPPTTITTGQASLGLNTTTISTISETNAVVTVDTTAPTLLAAGSLIEITNTSQPNFDGWFIVSTINSSTEFVISGVGIDSRGLGGLLGDSSTSSGGTIGFYLSNHVTWTPVKGAWEYYIYGERPGDSSYSLMGQTKPSSDGWVEAKWDDFGVTFMANQTFPLYVPASPPVAPTNNPLTTTIVSGAGTVNIVVADAASQSLGSTTALFDDAPAILAAANAQVASGGILFIPPSGANYYVVNSALTLPVNVNIKQGGTLLIEETIKWQSQTNWDGYWNQTGTPQFGFMGGATNVIERANPGIYLHGSDTYNSYITWFSPTLNGDTLWVVDDSVTSDWDYVNFMSGNAANSDTLGMDIIFRSTSTGGNSYHFRKSLFNGGPDQVADKSWTPLIYFPINQNGTNGGNLGNQNYLTSFLECFWNRRGIEHDAAGGSTGAWTIWSGYRQGGITPLLMLGQSVGQGGGSLSFQNVLQDTEGAGTVAFLSRGGAFQVGMDFVNVQNNSSQFNGIPPPITGTAYRSSGIRTFNFATGQLPNLITENTSGTCATTYPYSTSGAGCSQAPTKRFNESVAFPANHSLYWDLSAPTGVTVGVPTSGGTLTARTNFSWAVAAVGPDGGETVPSVTPASATTTSVNRTVLVSWKPVLGASSYHVYRCGFPNKCVTSDGRINNPGAWRLLTVSTITGTSFTDRGAGIGPTPAQMTGTGQAGINATEMFAPKFLCPETTAPTAVANFIQIYCDATGTVKQVTPDGVVSPVGTLVPIAVGSLPVASNNAGKIEIVNDSTAIAAEGQTCVGGNATAPNVALAMSNGSVWKCF
jgi:hypothetical protein